MELRGQGRILYELPSNDQEVLLFPTPWLTIMQFADQSSAEYYNFAFTRSHRTILGGLVCRVCVAMVVYRSSVDTKGHLFSLNLHYTGSASPP